jgi:hypothetical protein
VIDAGTRFPTYVWHYVVARLIYDHLVVVLIAIVVVLLLSAKGRR